MLCARKCRAPAALAAAIRLRVPSVRMRSLRAANAATVAAAQAFSADRVRPATV